jgi:hypothetical protein
MKIEKPELGVGLGVGRGPGDGEVTARLPCG